MIRKLLLILMIITVLPVGFTDGYLIGFEEISAQQPGTDSEDQIRPYGNNHWYWQYQGTPIVLFGGSGNDNLFQWTGEKLTDELDLLVSLGGNYVRNTMSDRSAGDVFAFLETEDGMYDLDNWNEEYWDRLKTFLNETESRGIIVQLTLWDQFDIVGDNWLKHPWNPENNNNLQFGAINNRDDFYSTVSDQNSDVLEYQKKFVEKLMSVTFDYGHVLYNINNESSEGSIWENYWAGYIHEKSLEYGTKVHVTSMQFDPSNSVRHVLSYPELYTFAEISQNNQDSRGGRGHSHWQNIMNWRKIIGSKGVGPMPMNNEKVYGSYDGRNYSAGSGKEAEARFWRNIFAGAASSRFHRDEAHWGIGLQERAQINIRAMSMFLSEFDLFQASPLNELLHSNVSMSTAMEAYCLADVGNQYAIYFPVGRYSIELDPWIYTEKLKVRWLDIDEGIWMGEEIIDIKWEGGREEWGDRGRVRLTTPDNKSYVAILEVLKDSSAN